MRRRLGSMALGFIAASTPIRPAVPMAAGSAHHSRGTLNLRSASALVMDQRTGEILVDKQAEAAVPIASLTKLMTAMVVLDANLDMNEELRIEKGDMDTIRYSHSRLPVGTHLTRGEALMLALVASENRAAHALGRTYPGGLPACIEAMNAKAKTLGLTLAHFDDPAGLGSGNVASARDMGQLVNAAYQYPVIRFDTTRHEVEIGTGKRRIAFLNTNGLVRNPHWTIGLSKTGYLEAAGKCLVMQTELAGRSVVIVLLDSWGKNTRLGDAARIRKWMEGAG